MQAKPGATAGASRILIDAATSSRAPGLGQSFSFSDAPAAVGVRRRTPVKHANGVRSAYTQAHGVRQTAQVISEDIGSGRNRTSTLAVRLGVPVDGDNTTTVHVADAAPTYSPGASVTVLVDPQDPGYAELPGSPFVSSRQWATILAVGLADIVIVPPGIVLLARRRWRSRRGGTHRSPRGVVTRS